MYRPQVPPIAICDWGGNPINVCVVFNNRGRSANRIMIYVYAMDPADGNKQCSGGSKIYTWMRLIVFGVQKFVAYQMQEGNV